LANAAAIAPGGAAAARSRSAWRVVLRAAAAVDTGNIGGEKSKGASVSQVNADIETRLLRIEGRVQGVGFREACVERAGSLGLAGHVRNRRDGSVEVMLQGRADAVARMQLWLHQGPPHARVDRVAPIALPVPVARLDGFERRPTE
jgi:acylphosphatase